MTEEEAVTKWCPFVRAATNTGNTSWSWLADAGYEPESVRNAARSSNRCIATDCMAWRWDEPWTSQTEEGQGGDVVIRLKRKPGEPRLGFCGLAVAVR